VKLRENGGVSAYTFEIFDQKGLVHGMFTRVGGVSPAPWSSLNLGGTVGDDRENVIENRRRIFATVNRPVDSIFDAWQVHGIHAIAANNPRPLESAHQKADIILTDQPHVTLFMRFADCVPILLYDTRRKVVSMVHAGWKGTLAKACSVAVDAMRVNYGCFPVDILTAIGPSICCSCYEVGGEVEEKARSSFGDSVDKILLKRGERYHLDLWEANRIALLEAGIKEDHIQVSGMCTAENTSLWFSHRGECGKTGRYGALIALES
jgi:YfiH family protein